MLSHAAYDEYSLIFKYVIRHQGRFLKTAYKWFRYAYVFLNALNKIVCSVIYNIRQLNAYYTAYLVTTSFDLHVLNEGEILSKIQFNCRPV